MDRIKRTRIQLDLLRDHKEQHLIGDHCTHLALKNSNSYMICTMKKGLKLIESGIQLYQGLLPIPNAWLKDAIYIEHKNCYLFDYNSKIYIKDVNELPPYEFMNLNSGYRIGSCLLYSEYCKRLFVAKDWKGIAMVNIDSKSVEVEMKNAYDDYMEDIKLFGAKKSKVVSFSKDGCIVGFGFDPEARKATVLFKQRVKLDPKTSEKACSVEICPHGRFVFVEVEKGNLKEKEKRCVSRYVIYEIDEKKLKKMKSLTFENKEVCRHLALASAYVGPDLVIIGLTSEASSVVQAIHYCVRDATLVELEDKTMQAGEGYPVKLINFDGDCFYTGFNGRFMRLRLQF